MRFRYLVSAMTWCLLLTLSQANVRGQSVAPDERPDPMFEQLTEHRRSPCTDFIYNAKLLIPRLHREGKLDSINIVLDFIDNACGTNSLRPLRDLLRIEVGSFPKNPCDSGFQKMILGRQWGRRSFFHPYYYTPWMSDFRLTPDSAENQYERFQIDLTDDLISSTDTNSIAHLAAMYFGGERDHVISRLRRDEFSGACLQDAYWREFNDVKHRLRENRLHVAGNLGAWVPLDSASTLGSKIEFGGQLGVRRRRFGFDLTLLLRFLKAKNEYAVMYRDTLRWTDHFVGGLVGGEINFELFRANRGSVEIFAGMAYDGIEAYLEDSSDRDNKNQKGINAFNVNFGLTPRLFINKERNRFIGLQLRYSIVDYVTHGGSDLSGNTLSVNLVYGYMGNIFATNRAKDLHLYD